MAVLVLVLVTAACNRNAEGQAATRAQDACIVALGPVAKGRLPTTDEIGRAARHAEAAAEVDDRWLPLRARVRELAATTARPAVDALADECRRVNDIVRGGQLDQAVK